MQIVKWDQSKEQNANFDETGLVRINPNKPEYGSMMFLKNKLEVNNNFVNEKKVIGFFTGQVEQLQNIIKNFNLKDGDDVNKKLGEPMNKQFDVIEHEKLESELTENDYYQPKKNPSTGNVLAKDGETIYRQTFIVDTNQENRMQERKFDHTEEKAPVEEAAPEFEKANQ